MVNGGFTRLDGRCAFPDALITAGKRIATMVDCPPLKQRHTHLPHTKTVSSRYQQTRSTELTSQFEYKTYQPTYLHQLFPSLEMIDILM